MDFVELLGVGALSALHRPVELGAFRGQHQYANAQLLAGRFKLCTERGSTVHLESTDGERHPVLHDLQELARQLSGRSVMGLQHIPTGHHIPSGTSLEGDGGQEPHIEGVQLDEITQAAGTWSPGLRIA